MLCRDVTLSTESWISHFEQSIVHCAVRFVAIGTIFHHGWMFPQKRAASFRVAGITIFINAVLLQLSRARASVRIVAVGAGYLSLPHGHVRGAKELRVALQVTLTANFSLRALGEKWRVLSNFGQLITIGCFLHDRVAIDTTDSSARMRARIPISLNSTLVARQAGLVLKSDRFATVLAKRDQPADPAAAARRHVIAARPMAVLAGLFLSFIARIEEKNFPHQRLGEFLELCGVARLTNFRADIGGRRFFVGFLRRFFNRFFFRRPSRTGTAKQKHTSQSHEKKSSHDFPSI